MKNVKFFLVLILVLISLLYSLLPLIPIAYRYLHRPANTVYLGAEKYYPDYYLYLNFLKQGENNQLLLQNNYTGEKINPTPIHLEYLIMGKIGALLHLATPLSFHLSRFFLNFLFVFVAFWFIGLFFSAYSLRLAVLLLALFYTGPFATYFYSPPDFLARASLDQHHILGEIFTLLAIGLFLKLTLPPYTLVRRSLGEGGVNRTPYTLLLLGLSSLALSYFFTTGILIIFATIGLFALFVLLTSKNLSSLKGFLLPFLMLLVFSLPILGYLFALFKTNASLINIAHFETYFSGMDAKEPLWQIISSYFFFFWPLAIFVVLGIVKMIFTSKQYKKSNQRWWFIWLYLATHFAFYFLAFQWFGISRMRLFRLPFMIFYSLMAVYGFGLIKQLLLKRGYRSLFFLLTVICYLFAVIPSYPQIFAREFSSGLNPVDNSVFIPKNTYQTLRQLSQYTSSQDTILANSYLSALIPGISGNIVFAGHQVNTIDYENKEKMTGDFFSNNMDSTSALKLLKTHQISFVLTDKSLPAYDFLHPVFKNGEFLLEAVQSEKIF